MRNQLAIAAAVCGALLTTGPANAEDNSLSVLDWFQGEWISEGREGDNGEVEGWARLYITPATEGALAATFQWNALADNHIHYAFTVLQEIENRVTGRGIHHGRDFEIFEEYPWVL